MKRNLFFISILAVFSLLSACWRDDLVPDPTDQRAKRTHLVVSASHWHGTKTTVQDGGTHVLWDTEETIKLFGAQDQAALTSTNAEPAATTDFTGEMIYTKGEKLYGLYPWREDAVCVDDTLITTLPFFQQARAGSFAKDMNLSVAESNSLEMTFMNVCGGVRFTLGNENIYRIILESNGGEPLAGKVWIRFDNGVPKVEKVEEACSRMILNVVGDGVFETGQWYYIVLLPGTISQGVKLTFYTTDGKDASVESPNALTIDRGIFLSKENIDAGVTEWALVDENTVEIKETSLEIEIPEEADNNYVSTLKLSNFYGDYDFPSVASYTGVMRQTEDESYSRVFDVNYNYTGNGMMMQFLKNENDETIMCCLAVPGESNAITPESTVINMLMTSPILITDNIAEYKATVAALKELDEFKALVAKARVIANEAMKNCKAPDYSSLDLNSTIRALIQSYVQTPDAIQGLDLLDVNRDQNARLISLKIRNTYRRVVHIYSRRVWMTDNNTAEMRSEDANLRLSDIMRAVVQYGNDILTNPKFQEYAEYFDDDIDESMVTASEDLLSEFANDVSQLDIIPFPHFLIPQSASYWKVVKGHLLDGETTSAFEATSDNLKYKLKDADKLFVDIYGIGKMDSFSTYDQQEKLRLYAVIFHGAYNDFLKPVIDLAAGLDPSQTDMRKGSRNAPIQAFLIELIKSLDPSEIKELESCLTEGDWLGATGVAIEHIWTELVIKSKPIYFSLLYNAFKKYIYTEAGRLGQEAFKTSLKAAFRKIHVVGVTISVLEGGMNITGSIRSALHSDCKTSFILDMDPNPSVTVVSPQSNAFISGQRVDVSWNMHMGNSFGNLTYDIKVYEGHSGGMMVKSFREIANTSYSFSLSDLPDIVADEKLKIQVIAHLPGYPNSIVAQSDLITIHIAAFQRTSEAVDLGLPSGLLWSSSNLGASTIYDPGDYYAWGELTPNKAEYTWDNYSYGSSETVSTYNDGDDLWILLPENDIVHQTLGGNWRMPTAEEWNELREYCIWTDVKDGEILVGYSIQSKKNKNAIFVPVSGYMEGTELMNPTQIRCWNGSRGEAPWKARNLNEGSFYYGGYYSGDDRCLGMPVRGVLDNSAKHVTPSSIVDLGLSVKWAGYNVGATSCEELGNYYSWGNIVTSESYDWEHNPWGNNPESITKYNDLDNLTILKREEDIAYQSLGGPYFRMPTKEEFNELQRECDWKLSTLNGQRGYVVKSRKNGNSIFLPIYGLKEGQQLRDGMKPRYWSSSRGEAPWKARNLNEGSYYYGGYYSGDDRCLGMPVRAVYDNSEQNLGLTPTDFVNMGLSVDWASCNMGSTLPEETGNYYSWAEKNYNSSYSWTSYKYCNDGVAESVSKYNDVDNLWRMNRDDDVVYLKYGTNYRTPTIEEWEELWNNCTKDLCRINNRLGYLLTSNINGNKIFLPLSGYYEDAQLHDGMRPRYWASTRGEAPWKARNLNEGSFYYGGYYSGDDRCLGMPIRGIRAKYEKGVSSGEVIDLGLSVKWASTNIGASAPELYGSYFAWGETASKSSFTWTNLKFCTDGVPESVNKYNDEDNRWYLDWTDDVVHDKKSGDWRMPTIEEWEELRRECDWEATTLNSIRGYRIVSRTNGNSIFLPSAGYKEDVLLHDGMRPRYWASTRGQAAWKARNLNEGSFYYGGYYSGDDRCLGMPVRGVYDDSVEAALTPGKTVDMGLSVDWASCNIGSSTPEGFGLYFSWGETSTQNDYSWETYSYCSDGVAEHMTQYNDEDNDWQLDDVDDAALLFSSGTLRMPTIEEWQELRINSDWEFKIKNGHPGYVVTSKINGNKIFLPYAGYKDGTQLRDGLRPRYWSSTRSQAPWKARSFNEGSYYYGGYYSGDDRCLGMPIRGVKD